MASEPAGAVRQQDQYANCFPRREFEGPADRSSRRPTLAAEDADAADILQAWDRARAAEDAGVQRGPHTDSGIGADGGIATADSRCQHSSAQNAHLRLVSTDGRKGIPSAGPSSAELSPMDRVRRAKQRRNSYSVPQSHGLALEVTPGTGPVSVSQQGAPQAPASGGLPSSRRPLVRRATLHDFQLDLTQVTSSPAQPSPSWGGQPPAHPPAFNLIAGAPSESGREQPPNVSGNGQCPNTGSGVDGVAGTEGASIRRKFIQMISLQRSRQRTVSAMSKLGSQGAPQAEEGEAAAPSAESESEEEAPSAPPAGPGSAPPRVVADDSDSEDSEDARGSGPPAAAPWNLGGAPGPSPSELRMMGATTSVSFKKSTLKQGVLRPLSTLPPFVPRLFIEDTTLNHEKYRGFDAAGRDLAAASKTLQPSIIELQAAVMIADVTGFTKLTEILSKKGTSGVELLTTCMNNYFTRAINMIMAFEGDVVKFAGDSMIVLFYPNEHERRHADKGLRACTLRMVACSHQLATKLGHMRMKMNGQVEPAAPPTPELQPSLPPQSTMLSAPLMSTLVNTTGRLASGDLEQLEGGGGGGGAGAGGVGSGGQQDVVRNNSGPFVTVASRRLGRNSPRDSAINQPNSGGHGGDEAASSFADGGSRVVDGSDASQTNGPRKRGKSWNLVASILKVNRGMPRRSDVNLTPAGSLSPAGASSSGPSRASFDKNDPKAASRMSARERAKTETGLGMALRGVGSAGAVEGGSSSNNPAALWGTEGVVRREMSVATKLNLPPPLRPMQHRTSLTLSPLNVASSATAAGGGSGPLASGVYPGSGGALASLGSAALSPTSGGSPRSFTEQAAASGGSFRRSIGARSERRMTGGPIMVGSAGTGDWRVKLQNLSTAIVQSQGVGRPEDDPLALQRSRLSESTRAVRWDTVQEEAPLYEEEEEDEAADSDTEEDASYPPIQSDPALPHSSGTNAIGAHPVGGPSGTTSSRPNGGHAVADVSAPMPMASGLGSGPGADRTYSPVGSQSAGIPRSAHFVDLRRKLLLRASQSDREDMQMRRNVGAHGPQREEGLGCGPGPIAEGHGLDPIAEQPGLPSVAESLVVEPGPEVLDTEAADDGDDNGFGSAPGPLGEGLEEGPPGRSRGNSDTERHGVPAEAGKQGSFLSKVVNWFSANNRNRGGNYVDSFSNVGGQHGGGGGVMGVHDATSDAQGSQPPSGPVSTTNSFNYASGLASGIQRVPPPNMGGGAGPLGKGPRGDPIMDEVSNSRLSLKVMTSAGSVCVFHVGGGVDEVTDPNQPEVPRWEFFIGDRPLAPLVDANQRRRCISQVAAIEDQATAGSVVASIEVVELVQGEWEVVPLPDNVWKVVGPAQPAPQGHIRLSHTSVRTSATSHTPHWRSSDVGGGSSLLPNTAEGAQTVEAPQTAEAIEDLAALQTLRLTSSATNGQQAASSAGQPSSTLGPLNRSLGNSLNGSSDRPTNGSGVGGGPLRPVGFAAGGSGHLQHASGLGFNPPGPGHHQQSLLAGPSQSARYDPDGAAGGQDSAAVESTNSATGGALAAAAAGATGGGGPLAGGSQNNSHHALHPTGSSSSHAGAPSGVVVPHMSVSAPAPTASLAVTVSIAAAGAGGGGGDGGGSHLTTEAALHNQLHPVGSHSSQAGGALAAAGAAAAAAAQLPPRLRHEFVNQPDHVQRRIAGLLRMHVLGSVRVRVEAGHLDFINEIRPLTCMFLGFPSLLHPRDDVSHKDQVQCVQFAYTSVQGVMRKWDGSFLQFRSDEKGFVGICAFGLPGHTHEDNPARGVRAALELASTVKAGGHTVSIGVTTGDLLCTCVGARKLRSEYTVFGDAINLSARLMVKCKKEPSMGDILCDELTYQRAKYQASFVELEPLPVKGKALPVLVYQVGAHDATAEAQAAQQRREAAEVSSGERPLIGRDAEMTFTLNQAATMISGETHGGIVIIEGNTGMGKTKLLMEIRKSLERINADTSVGSRPAFHMVFGMADTANKSQKLHPWRRVFQELFALDLKLKSMSGLSTTSQSAVMAGVAAAGGSNAGGGGGQRRTASNTSTSGQVGGAAQGRRRGTDDGPGYAVFTALGERLSKVPNYDTEWRQHLAELLDLPLPSIPLGSLEAEQAQYAAAAAAAQAAAQLQQQGSVSNDPVGGDAPAGSPASPEMNGGGLFGGGRPTLTHGAEARESLLAPSLATSTPNSMMRSPAPWRASSMRHSSVTMPGPPPVILDAHSHASTINLGAAMGAASAAAAAAAAAAASAAGGAGGAGVGAPASEVPAPSHVPHSSQVGAPIRKNSLNFLVHVMQEFIQLYGPTLALLENLHDFDTWSWQLLVKAAEVLTTDCMILATTRPNDLPPVGPSHHLHGRAALYQKVAMMYRHLLKLPSATRIVLEPFNFVQTKNLMQVVSNVAYPEQYVLAVMEKTGGMPLYIEKVTEFLCQTQRPWLPDHGGEFSANVNKMIRNLNFQQVIIERMDRLKPGIHLSLKVASVMGQWVDLDILHKFYPINKSKEELRAHLQELERGNFLKPTDTEGVWEFNMVERDIVYEVIPHYQRRRLHAKLAQELEKSLEEQHVATLTTIAYHWNQACMGHEVTEVECSLKAIEFWHRAAEAAYSDSSLMEALKLYQKAAQIAEVLAESMGGSITAGNHALAKSHDRGGHGGGDGPYSGGSTSGVEGTSLDGRIDATDQSFTAVGSAYKGQLNWALISRLSRSQWEKSMASCCLGIVLQHRYEFNTQLEYWDTEDYFRLLTEHAIRGLMLLGAPHPKELLNEKEAKSGGPWLGRLLGGGGGCCGLMGAAGSGASAASQHGWHTGLVLQDSEVREIRDILLVLIIAAEHYSSQHNSGEYTRLLMFCKRVCKFFNKCSDTGTDPFLDIRSACSSRIKNFKASRAMQSTFDFGISQEPGLEAAAARNPAVGNMVGPELSRAVLGWQRQGTLGRGGVYG